MGDAEGPDAHCRRSVVSHLSKYPDPSAFPHGRDPIVFHAGSKVTGRRYLGAPPGRRGGIGVTPRSSPAQPTGAAGAKNRSLRGRERRDPLTQFSRPVAADAQGEGNSPKTSAAISQPTGNAGTHIAVWLPVTCYAGHYWYSRPFSTVRVIGKSFIYVDGAPVDPRC